MFLCMWYLNNIIKDTHEIISIYSWKKCTSKEIQNTVSVQLLRMSIQRPTVQKYATKQFYSGGLGQVKIRAQVGVKFLDTLAFPLWDAAGNKQWTLSCKAGKALKDDLLWSRELSDTVTWHECWDSSVRVLGSDIQLLHLFSVYHRTSSAQGLFKEGPDAGPQPTRVQQNPKIPLAPPMAGHNKTIGNIQLLCPLAFFMGLDQSIFVEVIPHTPQLCSY